MGHFEYKRYKRTVSKFCKVIRNDTDGGFEVEATPERPEFADEAEIQVASPPIVYRVWRPSSLGMSEYADAMPDVVPNRNADLFKSIMLLRIFCERYQYFVGQKHII